MTLLPSIRRTAKFRLIGLVAGLVSILSLSGATARTAGLSQGSATIARGILDSAACQVYIYGGGTFEPNTRVTSITWYVQGAGAGHQLTPVLFEKTSPNLFVIRGVGTPRVAIAGLNSAPFGLTYGSDVITNANFTWGFVNSSVAPGGAQSNATTGAVDFDYALGGEGVGGAGTTNTWYFTPSSFGPGAVLSLGFSFGLGTAADHQLYQWETRAYSAYMTTEPVVSTPLTAAPGGVELWATAGSASPFQVPVSIDAPADVAASGSAPWITVTPAGAASGASTVRIGANASTLSPGTHRGVVTLASGGDTATVSVTLHVARPQGALGLSSARPAAASPISIGTADFNHDGRTDFAVTNEASADAGRHVQVLTQQADGSFASQRIDIGGMGSGVAIGDVNGDGWEDVATASFGASSVDVLVNDAAGGFTRVTLPLGDGQNALDVAAGDLDGDGRADLFAANFSNNAITVFRATADGFAAPTQITGCGRPTAVATGHFNGDRALDVAAVCNADGTARVFLGDGAGGFTAAPAGPLSVTGANLLAVGDLDGDGLQDLVVTGFNDALVFFGHAQTGVRASGLNGLPPGIPAIADIDGDGRPDVVISSGEQVRIFAGDGAGGLVDRGTHGEGFAVSDLVVADFDGDGTNDIVGPSPANAEVRALVTGPASTTSDLQRPASAVFGSPVVFPFTVTTSGALNPALLPNGTGQLFLCDNTGDNCVTPASAPTPGTGTYALTLTLPLDHAYYYFRARYTPSDHTTAASDTNPLGLPITQASSTLVLAPPASQPIGDVPFQISATITPSGASGPVKFYDAAHGTLLATAPIVDGVATAAIPGLPARLFFTLQARYAGDNNVLASTSNDVDFQVGDVSAATLVLIGLEQEWSGQPLPVLVQAQYGVPVRVTYNGSEVVPSDIGEYAVRAESLDASHPGSVTGTYRIVPNRNATIDVAQLTVTYDGQPHGVTPTTQPAGLNVTTVYRNADTNQDLPGLPVEPGTYFAIMHIDDPRAVELYQGFGVVTIAKKMATVTLSDMVKTRGVDPVLAPTVTVTPAGLNVVVTYDGVGNPAHGNGSYTVVASVDDPHWQGSATGTFVIQAPAFTITNTTQTFDGTPKAVTVTPGVPGTPYTVTYNGSTTVPTNAGTYTVVVTSTDPNAPGTGGATLTIRKGTGSFEVSGTTATYTGAPRPVAVTTTPAGLQVTVTYNGSPTAPTAPGSYAFTATLTDPNVNSVAPQSGTLTIQKGTAVVTLGTLSQGDTGQPHPVTITTDPAGLAVSVTYNGSPTPPTAAGSYAVVATVTDPNYSGSANGTLTVVPRAATTLSVQYGTQYLPRNGPGVQAPNIAYGAATVTISVNSLALPLTGRIQVLDTFNNASTSVIYDSQTAATPPVSFTVTLPIGMHQFTVGYQGDEFHQSANLTSTFNIVRAPTNIFPDFPSLTQTFNGQPKTLPFTVYPQGTTYTVTYDGSTTPPTDAGTYRVVLRTTDPNVVPTTLSYTLTINRMTATVSLDGLTQVADGAPKTVTAISTPPLPPGYAMEITYDGRNTPPTAIGTYRVRASNPNITGTATGTLTLLAPITITGGPFTYDGTPKAATVTFLAPVTRLRSVVYSNATYNSETPPTNAGTYTVTATGCAPRSGCDNEVTGTLVINRAQVGLGFGALTNGTTGRPVPVSVNWSPSSIANLPVTVTYNGSTTAPTNVGSYTVVAAVNSPNFVATTITGTYFIVPGQTEMTLASRRVRWTGQPQALTGTISPSNAPYTITYERVGGFPSTTPPSQAGLYAVTMAATGGYAGRVTATLQIDGYLTLNNFSSGQPLTFTVDGNRVNANTQVVTPGAHTVVAQGQQVNALQRYVFDYWEARQDVSLGGVPTVMPSSVTSLGNGILVAHAKNEYAVATNVVSGSGTVTGDGWYSGTARVPLVATPAAGYLFDAFIIDGNEVTENPYTLSMANAGHRVRVRFVPAANVTMRVNRAGWGSTSANQIVKLNDVTTVEAYPMPGFRFGGWQITGGQFVGGPFQAGSNPGQIRATSTNVTVTATFEPVVDIEFIERTRMLGEVHVTLRYVNRSSVTVTNLQITGASDSSAVMMYSTATQGNIGTLAPGQGRTVELIFVTLTGAPPQAFTITPVARSTEGWVYSRSIVIQNF